MKKMFVFLSFFIISSALGQGINPITPPSNWLIQVSPPASANPSNFYAAVSALGSSITSGTTPCTGCASSGVLFNNGGVVTSDSGFTYAGANGAVGINSSIQFAAATGTIKSAALSNLALDASFIFFNTAAGGGGSALQPTTTTGVFAWVDNSGTNFNRMQFGGTTSAYPSLKRSTTSLQVRLADDSGYGSFDGGAYLASGTAGVSCVLTTIAHLTVVNGIVTLCN